MRTPLPIRATGYFRGTPLGVEQHPKTQELECHLQKMFELNQRVQIRRSGSIFRTSRRHSISYSRRTVSSARLTYLSSPYGCSWHNYGQAHLFYPGYQLGVPCSNNLCLRTCPCRRASVRAYFRRRLSRQHRIATKRNMNWCPGRGS